MRWVVMLFLSNKWNIINEKDVIEILPQSCFTVVHIKRITLSDISGPSSDNT